MNCKNDSIKSSSKRGIREKQLSFEIASNLYMLKARIEHYQTTAWHISITYYVSRIIVQGSTPEFTEDEIAHSMLICSDQYAPYTRFHTIMNQLLRFDSKALTDDTSINRRCRYNRQWPRNREAIWRLSISVLGKLHEKLIYILPI